MVERLCGSARDAGRNPADIGIEPRLNLDRTPADTWADYLAGWRDLGATHLCVNTMGLGHSTADDHVASLGAVLEAIRAT
jgi:hypothetical protein